MIMSKLLIKSLTHRKIGATTYTLKFPHTRASIDRSSLSRVVGPCVVEREREMNIGPREQRAFARMTPEDRAWLIKGKSVVLTCLASVLLLSAGSIKAPKTCTGGMFLGPIIAIGLFLIVMFVVGSCGLKKNDGDLYDCYLLGVFLAILLLLAFIIFGYVAVGGIDAGHAANAREYSLSECKRGWLRGRVTHSSHFWASTSACLRRSHVCNGMTNLSGCCKPPSSCGLTYVNGTTWISTAASAGAPAAVAQVTNNNKDDDCSRWSNDHQTLCFQCDSCKAGFLRHTSQAWSVAAIYIVLAFIGLILSSLALYADQATGNNNTGRSR
nr:protein TORNADO 2 isoform X2 [Oryza sativa Japonica Group]